MFVSIKEKEKDESLTKRSYTACDISAAFSLRPKPSFPPEIHAQTHEHRQTQSLPYVRGPARSPVSPLQAQWGPGIQQSLIRGGAGSCGRLLHPAWPCSQLRGLHGGLASGSFHQPSLPRGTGSLPSSENLGPQDVVVCCGGSAKERVRLCEHLISGAEGRGLRGSSGLAPRSVVLSLWSWPHAASFPTSYEQLHRAAFPTGEGKMKITIWNSAVFLQYFRSSKDFFCAKKKKKKVFHLPRFLLITYERKPSSTHF